MTAPAQPSQLIEETRARTKRALAKVIADRDEAAVCLADPGLSATAKASLATRYATASANVVEALSILGQLGRIQADPANASTTDAKAFVMAFRGHVAAGATKAQAIDAAIGSHPQAYSAWRADGGRQGL
jgi:hypothetical protein